MAGLRAVLGVHVPPRQEEGRDNQVKRREEKRREEKEREIDGDRSAGSLGG
jgi:hypothetical protein